MRTMDEITLIVLRDLGKKTREALEKGEADSAQKFLEEGWGLIPEPKYEYDITTRKILASIRLMAQSTKPTYALRWINELKNYPSSDIDDEPEFLIGMTYFELGERDKAFLHFDISNNISKGRCFREEDPKYLKFYLENKKGI